MSMPEFPTPNPDMTSEQALTMILSSIALEEVALSHIINAEGEKIQHVLHQAAKSCCPGDTADILAVNRSVTNMLEMVMQNQLLLKTKMDRVLDYLPRPPCPPPLPPCPPRPPCPCPPPPCEPELPICVEALPSCYMRDEALEWTETCCCNRSRFAVNPKDATQIFLPRTGEFMVNFAAEYCHARPPEKPVEMEMVVYCGEKTGICKRFYDTSCNSNGTLDGTAVIRMPCPCAPCYASVFLRSPECLRLKWACLSFTPL